MDGRVDGWVGGWMVLTIECFVLPLNHSDRFQQLGLQILMVLTIECCGTAS